MDLPTFLPPLMSSSTSNPTTNNPPPSISVPTPTLLPILSDLPTLLTRATIISVSSTPTSTITLTPTPTPTPIINIVETVSSISSILSIPATISTPPTSVFVPLVSAASSPLLFVSSPTLTPSSNTFSRNLEPSAIVRRLTPKSTWASGMKLWGLDIMDGVLNDAYVTEHTGQGPVHLYYLGPGMIGNHPEFKTNQINSLYSALGLREGSSFSLDCNGQGTAVGGILVSNTMGVATDAQVHVLRVQDCDGIDTLSLDKAKHVIDALTFLQSQIQRPAVIQLSFLPNLGKDITEINTLKTLLGYFVNTLGVPVVVPAGDNASNKCVTNGLLDKLQGLISVCAHDENFNAIASSNFGDCCTVYAPGANIWSLSNQTQPPLYAMKSGTTFAASFVTGLLATYLEENPNAKALELQKTLERLSTRAIADGAGSMKPTVKLKLSDLTLTSSIMMPTTDSKYLGLPLVWFIVLVVSLGLGAIITLSMVLRRYRRYQLRQRAKRKIAQAYQPSNKGISIRFSEYSSSSRASVSSLSSSRASISSFYSSREASFSSFSSSREASFSSTPPYLEAGIQPRGYYKG